MPDSDDFPDDPVDSIDDPVDSTDEPVGSTDEPGDLPEATSAPSAADMAVARYDPVRRYLQELRQFKPLTAEEEKKLAIRHQEHGDVEAASKLVMSQMRLVVRIAFDFKRSWQNLLDLIQEGNVGLLLAVRKFDPYRDIRLSTYASWWIRAYIIKFILDNWRMVKVGTTNARRKLLFNLTKEKDALIAQGIEPGTKLLADRLNVSEEDVIEVDRSLGMSDLSLEAPTGPDSELLIGDTLPAPGTPIDEHVALEQRRDIINQKLEQFALTLPPRERAVFSDRLLAEEPATLRELGERFDMTREGLRQVEKRLLRNLKAFLTQEFKGLTGIEVTSDVTPISPKKVKTPGKKRAARKRKGAKPATPEKRPTETA